MNARARKDEAGSQPSAKSYYKNSRPGTSSTRALYPGLSTKAPTLKVDQNKGKYIKITETQTK
ncbi:conserved hypothetical protein [Ricinus communis]|uniref:Uncharacterized protein n=1 Tax=Ricinus communis TaxID=3988 RepID=B9RPY1_RICCO|nr:conserved hypothetical protein [Ricinus communis]